MTDMLLAAPPAPTTTPVDWTEFDGTEGEAKSLTMNPVGPVATRFQHDRRYFTGLMGPYGSGKTTTCFQKILNATMWQNVNPRTKMRHSRGMVMRSTYGQLLTNVLADWFSWFGKDKDNWNGEEMKHVVQAHILGIGRVRIEVLFRACEDAKKAEQLLKGVNLTWLWLNEMDTLTRAVFRFGAPRVGRYPPARDGGCAWSGIFGDLNAPDIDNWTYDFLVNKNLGLSPEQLEKFKEVHGARFDVGFHQQPAGDSPEAENLANLFKGYYDQLRLGMTSENDVRRFIKNEFGAVLNGQPVYPGFIDDFHVSKEDLKPIPGIPLTIGLDGGSTPAAVILQMSDRGQIRVLGEVVICLDEDDKKVLVQLGPDDFADLVRKELSLNYADCKIGDVWADPSNAYGEGWNEKRAFNIEFAKKFGKKVKSSKVPGNRIAPRLETVRRCLKNNVGPEPGILVSPRARMLRQGFRNGYVMERIKSSAGDDLKDTPAKTMFSHVHDALQYGVFMLKKVGQALEDMDGERTARRRAVAKGGNVKFSGHMGG